MTPTSSVEVQINAAKSVERSDNIEFSDIDIIVVDSATTLASFLENLISLPVKPPSLYLDLEGVKLGRRGSISIISLYILPLKKIYLIDIHSLGNTAFSTTNRSAASLKTILESQTIPKVIFDIRSDSDALFSHFQISVNGIQDLQLMELATRKGSKDIVVGLAKCIENDSLISAVEKEEWQRTKEGTRHLFDPKKGGRFEIFNDRPIKPEIIQYCARDISLLPGLYNVYNAKLCLPGEAHWQTRVFKATKDRIKLSQSPKYDEQTTWQKIRGPWYWHKGVFERDKPTKKKTTGSGSNPGGSSQIRVAHQI